MEAELPRCGNPRHLGTTITHPIYQTSGTTVSLRNQANPPINGTKRPDTHTKCEQHHISVPHAHTVPPACNCTRMRTLPALPTLRAMLTIASTVDMYACGHVHDWAQCIQLCPLVTVVLPMGTIVHKCARAYMCARAVRLVPA